VVFAGSTLCYRPVLVSICLSIASANITGLQDSATRPIRCGVEMRNVVLHVQDGMALHITSLDGDFVSRVPNKPPVFDDPGSYVLRLAAGEFIMDAPTLTRLLREQVFSDSRSPVRNVSLSIAEGKVHVKGRLRKGIEVPFSMSATIGVTSDGRIQLHATSLKAIGIPVKGMLDLFGLELENLMKLPAGRGIKSEGDDLLLDPFAMLPPPVTEGRVKNVRIVGDRLLMSAIGPSKLLPKPGLRPDRAAKNFIYFYAGVITFGKLTMTDADLQLVDSDARDPFDFFPAHYSEQLVAGYSRNTARGGLRVMMPDYHRVRSGQRLPAPKIVRTNRPGPAHSAF
jgi:hypothetical protein